MATLPYPGTHRELSAYFAVARGSWNLNHFASIVSYHPNRNGNVLQIRKASLVS
jgi:hypothetical protein